MPGDGFVTDPALIRSAGLSDANPFFAALLRRPYASRTVLAPHMYPPAATAARLNGTATGSGPELFSKLDASWGQLAREGYCAGSVCRRFPVVIGGPPGAVGGGRVLGLGNWWAGAAAAAAARRVTCG